MKCRECLTHLEDFFDGELDVSQKEVIERHLTECPSCQAEFSQLESLRQDIALAVEAIPLPVGLENRLLAGVLRGGLAPEDSLLTVEQASIWNVGLLLSLLSVPLLFLLHPFTLRVLSLIYGISRVFGRGLYVLSDAVPPVWLIGLGLAGLVVLSLGMVVVWKLVQEIPLREVASP